ncbi:unnamed protein product [Chondrus crispus]|uniref:C2H2-type domain-containing protein n=1 Tax=Chondrus crispus TaxID=2769 RepID=R7QT12_CHOCR|nr:unnamed protein product [Chondrus crispus]CDF40485.1 unnamed protein product [Chondrus crispus]|eukprot:XP_005710779.1 unnamed protein product [Chondrus crispus]
MFRCGHPNSNSVHPTTSFPSHWLPAPTANSSLVLASLPPTASAMPDSRLSIEALVNGPMPSTRPCTTSPLSSSPCSSSDSFNSLSYAAWTRDSNVPSPSTPLLPPTGPVLAPLRTPSPSRRPSEPLAPTSPQTVIVKTPRGKRHRCNFRGCGRDFTRLSNLKAHWRRHSGEEPYACVHCTRTFKWRSSLKSHELGCVYEFTKANSGLRWVYVDTDQRRGTEQSLTAPKPEPVLRPLANGTKRPTPSMPYEQHMSGYGPKILHPQGPNVGPLETRTYV